LEILVLIALFNKNFVNDWILALQISRIFTQNNCYAIFRLPALLETTTVVTIVLA